MVSVVKCQHPYHVFSRNMIIPDLWAIATLIQFYPDILIVEYVIAINSDNTINNAINNASYDSIISYNANNSVIAFG